MEKNIVFKLGELFCGPGGLALGAALARKISSKNGESFSISHIWGVDKDKDAIETYRLNIAKRYGGEAVCMDATEFCDKEISNYPKITALAFGFPCNDYSNVGERKGMQGKYGDLYKAGIAAIEKCNPYWFIAENVSGLHSNDSGKTFKKILHELENAGKYGYTLTINLYKFEQYGVPQYRHRYIIVGIRKDKHLNFKVPAPTHPENSYKTASKALSNIPTNAKNHDLPKLEDRVILRLKFTPPWHNAWYLDKLVEMSAMERREILKKLSWYHIEFENLTDNEIYDKLEYARLKCEKARMSHIYKRLDADKPSYTITGSGGGGTHVYHWCEHRSLTNREKARLQSFPDWFEFAGTKTQVRKQIGMAVPSIASKIIFKSILRTFAGINYKSVEPSFIINGNDLEFKAKKNLQLSLLTC
jgi:DNA (cytosine-5)-methyltransferase 1